MRHFLTSILLVALSVTAMARVRSVQEATAIAQQFISTEAQVSARGAVSSVQLVTTIEQSAAIPAVYVFSRGDQAGVLLVSADDRTRAVLGYTDRGNWDSEHLPTNMQAWLQHYAEQITSLDHIQPRKASANAKEVMPNGHKSTLQPQPKTISTLEPQAPKRHVQDEGAVLPILGDMEWNQDVPFNDSCPTDPDNAMARCYTGCVATAAAQIMRAWKSPAAGTGSHSYYWEYGSQTISRSFEHTYDWTNMLLSYNDSYTTAQGNAVATLMYDLGVASEMEYGGDTRGGSGTMNEIMARAMQQYFGYDKTMYCARPDFMGEEMFEQYVEKELRDGRPLLMSGCTSTSGHAFVCDGLDDQGFFHINWGWGGLQNGHFALSALDPMEEGIGGSLSQEGYNQDVLAIMYIFPDKGNDSIVQVGALKVTTDKTAYKLSDSVTVILHTLENIGLATWNGNLCAAIYDAEGSYMGQIGKDYEDAEMRMLTYYDAFLFEGAFPQLSEGRYAIKPIYSTLDGKWYLVASPDSLTFTVRGDSVFVDLPESEVIDLSDQIDVVYAGYNPTDEYWMLVLGNETTEIPWIQFGFPQEPTKIAGSYTIDSNDWKLGITSGYMWLSNAAYYDVFFISGTLDIKRLADAKDGTPVYHIDMEAKGNDNNEYLCHVEMATYLYNYDTEEEIHPADPIDTSIITPQTTEEERTTKQIINGHLFILHGNQTYSILGQKIK